jgi:hypothetical protein
MQYLKVDVRVSVSLTVRKSVKIGLLVALALGHALELAKSDDSWSHSEKSEIYTAAYS